MVEEIHREASLPALLSSAFGGVAVEADGCALSAGAGLGGSLRLVRLPQAARIRSAQSVLRRMAKVRMMQRC
jgi:hypothetical protein